MADGWWPRNRWALPAMIITLAGLAWPLSEPARDVWWPGAPHRSHQPADDGWTSLAQTKIRLADLARIDESPEDELGDEPAIPDDYQVWRAELEVRADGGKARVCDVDLSDAEGRVYASGSYHVPSFEDESVAVECGSGEDPGGVVYFLLPADAEPAAIRVTATGLYPDYWELPAATGL